MWSYYGSKRRIVKCYPRPLHNKIKECFAGSAPYSIQYFENDVYLYDKYPVIIEIWKYLQQCSVNDILSLKCPAIGTVIGYDKYDCNPQRWLVGFMIARVQRTPANTVTSFGAQRFDYDKKRIADGLFKIKHWKIECISYELINDEIATWFIDAPYQFGGETYKESSKKIDFNNLASWCMSRSGQLIVCENTKADWLPFVPIKQIQGVAKQSVEAIFTNYHTHYNNVQLNLF